MFYNTISNIVATRCIANFMENSETAHAEIIRCLNRFFKEDWGEMCKEDCLANKKALISGARLFGAYKVENEKIWIIADAVDDAGKRLVTVLFPDEY